MGKSLKERQRIQIQIAKKDLNMDDDAYRTMLKAIAGVTSSTKLDLGGQGMVLQYLKKTYRWKPKAKRDQGKSTEWRKPRIAKITALWFILFEADVIQDKSLTAMEHWCSTLTRKNSLNWSTSADLNKCIEGLKSWCNRMDVKHD